MNRAIGWTMIAVGIASGLVMGLWSFDGPMATPAWLGAYADTSRRLARLGHIAFLGLGILNVLLANELPQSGLSARARRIASRHMNFGNVVLPINLFAAAMWRPAKYAMGVPATAVFVAMCLAAWGAWRARASADQRGH